MAKIPRKTQKIFASSAGATGITEFGSPASGTPVYSTDLDDIQTAAWDGGWADAALAGTEIPTFQDFNGIHRTETQQIAYLLQEGIPEYDVGTEYHLNSIVKKTGTYELYGSKINTNLGNALPSAVDNANWEYLGNLSDLGFTIFGLTTTTPAIDDFLPFSDTGDSNNPKKATIDNILKSSDRTAKAWANFHWSGSAIVINDSFGVSGIVRNSAGVYTVTVSEAFSNSDFVPFVSINRNIDSVTESSARALSTTTFKVITAGTDGFLFDPFRVHCLAFG